MKNNVIYRFLLLSAFMVVGARTGVTTSAWDAGLWGDKRYNSMQGKAALYSSIEGVASQRNALYRAVYGHNMGNLSALHVNAIVNPKMQLASSTDSQASDMKDQLSTDFAARWVKNDMTVDGSIVGENPFISYPPIWSMHFDAPLVDITGRTVDYSTVKTGFTAGFDDPTSDSNYKLAKAAYDDIGSTTNAITNDEDGNIYWNFSGNDSKINNMLALLKHAKMDKMVVDTGMEPTQLSSGDQVNIFKTAKTWVGLPNIGVNRSPVLNKTLYGRVLAGLGAVMSSSAWPADALLSADIPANGVDHWNSATPGVNTSDLIRLSVLRRWQAYNENWRGDLPFYRTGFGETLTNDTQEQELQKIKDSYTSEDNQVREAAFDRTLGTTRAIKPILYWDDVDGRSTSDRIPAAIVPDKNPKLIDEDILHTPEDETDHDAVSVPSSWNGTTQAVVLGQIDTELAAVEGKTGDYTAISDDEQQKLKGAYSYFRYLVQREGSGTINVATILGAAGSTTTDQAIKAGRVGVMYRRFSNLLPTLDTSTDWNASLFDKSKQLMRRQNLALYIPGKQVQIKRGTGTVTGKYADNKTMWIPDWEEARKGSTFGTVSALTAAPTGVKQDAARAYLMILDCARLLDESFYTAANSVDMTINGVTMKRFNDATYTNPWSVLDTALTDLSVGYSAEGASIATNKVKDIAVNSNAVYSSQGKWIENPFKHAVDSLRYGYAACSNRFNEIMKALDTAGVTWSTRTVGSETVSNKPTTFVQTFMYGGDSMNWASTGVTVQNGDSFHNATNFASGTKAWVMGAKNLPETTSRMPLVIMPTETRGSVASTYTELLNGGKIRSLAHLTSVGFKDERGYTLAGNTTDNGKHELLCFPHDGYNMAEAVLSASNAEELLNTLIITI